MASFSSKVFDTIKETTSLPHSDLEQLKSNLSEDGNDQSITTTLTGFATSLNTLNHVKEATVIDLVLEKAIDSPSHGGLGVDPKTPPPSSTHDEVLFLISAHLTTLLAPNRDYLSTIPQPHSSTHPMTLAQKIFSQHVLGHCPPTGLTVGSVTRVGLDWILASELSWSEMARTYQKLGAPGIWRNDRFWLAGDHLVHPDVMSDPKIKKMVDVSEKAKTRLQNDRLPGHELYDYAYGIREREGGAWDAVRWVRQPYVLRGSGGVFEYWTGRGGCNAGFGVGGDVVQGAGECED